MMFLILAIVLERSITKTAVLNIVYDGCLFHQRVKRWGKETEGRITGSQWSPEFQISANKIELNAINNPPKEKSIYTSYEILPQGVDYFQRVF